MADLPPGRPAEDGADSTDAGPGGMATWQKAVGVIGLAVAVALAALLATGDHGPGRHVPSNEQQQPTSVEDAPGHDPSRWNH
jgi:hypothetical protein